MRIELSKGFKEEIRRFTKEVFILKSHNSWPSEQPTPVSRSVTHNRKHLLIKFMAFLYVSLFNCKIYWNEKKQVWKVIKFQLV